MIEALAQEDRGERHDDEEGDERNGQRPAGPHQDADHDARCKQGDEGGRHGMGVERLDRLDIPGWPWPPDRRSAF